jgi:hypothetical protein
MTFVDIFGREHRGEPGDYLVESSEGRRTIQRREIFEDVYVTMGPADETWPSCVRRTESLAPVSSGITTGPPATA